METKYVFLIFLVLFIFQNKKQFSNTINNLFSKIVFNNSFQKYIPNMPLVNVFENCFLLSKLKQRITKKNRETSLVPGFF